MREREEKKRNTKTTREKNESSDVKDVASLKFDFNNIVMLFGV